MAGDELVGVDTSKIRDGAERFGVLADRARALVGRLHGVPDPVGSAGDGSDALSRSFLGTYRQLRGPETEHAFDTLGRGLDGLAGGLTDLAAGFERADGLAVEAAAAARGVVGQSRV
jgi:hypothetical protein